MLTFNNKEPLDLNFIRIMGASVKSDSAIGYFGTGLKYALAVLLRTGHSVTITASGVRNTFSVRQQSLRGKDFSIVYMNDEQLGFTTELGKNWEVWMAFRELYSNMLDEKGWIDGEPGETSIEVDGKGILEAYQNRRDYFILDRMPLEKGVDAEFYDGPSEYIFYRGVRIFELQKSLPYTLNILADTRLTEDRTLGTPYQVYYRLGWAIARATKPEIFRLTMNWNVHDMMPDIDYGSQSAFSETFKQEAMAYLQKGGLDPKIRKMFRHTLTADMVYIPARISPFQERQLQASIAFLNQHFDTDLQRDQIIITKTLDSHVLACWDEMLNVIVLTEKILLRGELYISTVLYEEYLHKAHGFHDESRELQSFLFEKLMNLAYDHYGE